MSLLNQLAQLYQFICEKLESLGTWLPSLFLRLILAWEFGEAGFEKLNGSNWFANLTFPFPFNLLPPDISWGIATFFEIVGAFVLALGLATRFFSISLLILTIVAISAVHWPDSWNTVSELLKGYRISDPEQDGFGNYKLPLIYILMLIPLVLNGAGKLSVDHLIKKFV